MSPFIGNRANYSKKLAPKYESLVSRRKKWMKTSPTLNSNISATKNGRNKIQNSSEPPWPVLPEWHKLLSISL